MLKLGIHMDNELLYCGIELFALILPFICPFFIQFSLCLYLDCLEFVLQFSLQLSYCSLYIAVLY